MNLDFQVSYLSPTSVSPRRAGVASPTSPTPPGENDAVTIAVNSDTSDSGETLSDSSSDGPHLLVPSEPPDGLSAKVSPHFSPPSPPAGTEQFCCLHYRVYHGNTHTTLHA